MERNVSKNGLLNWLALMGAGTALFALSRTSGSATGEVGASFLFIGFLVALVSWFQMRLEMREHAERLEMEELAKSRAGTALFQNSSEDTLIARKARQQFEKWAIPAFTILLFALEAAGVWLYYERLSTMDPPIASKSLFSLAMFSTTGLVLFLLGTYSSKLARYEGHRLLRPGASAMVMGAVICAIAAVTEVTDYLGYVKYDRWAAWALIGILALVAFETLIALVFEAFRPRVKGREVRLVYESRLIGLLGSPDGLFTTAAQALDYQFGFKVSQTWFFQFLQERLGRLVLFWAGLYWISTSFVFLEPTEQGVLERFGKPVVSREVLEPGWHLKLPWPVDALHRYSVRELQSFNIGFEADPAKEKERTLLWTVPHYKTEVHMLVASREQATLGDDLKQQAVPVNFLSVSIPVQYTIKNVREWAYNHANPSQLLERVANREVVRYLVSVDMLNIMGPGRLKAANELQTRIQKVADENKLGVDIAFVGLQDIHPPPGDKDRPVAAAFEREVGALAQKEALILEAEGDVEDTLPRAAAEAHRRVNEASAAAATKVEVSQGLADQFEAQRLANNVAPGIFKMRAQLDTLARGYANARKYVIVSTNAHRVMQIDLQDKIREDILDTVIDSPNKPKDSK